ncbi:MAG TPA: hypothetical protein DDW51_03545 [Cyanobacteria bacterium UBA11367]|nr:hypothetical protein [Cyanobacteria bacterium UBA11367]HBS70614.1 hypothetical protein [Cyanobacteria bacterium UBA11153]
MRRFSDRAKIIQRLTNDLLLVLYAIVTHFDIFHLGNNPQTMICLAQSYLAGRQLWLKARQVKAFKLGKYFSTLSTKEKHKKIKKATPKDG